ncbi:hypothetical protein SK128_010002 [Halocaridina rubra]|uniref:Alpha-2-macroglobulin bait region domain-containing protein n=1 Tax=Halocaridina rubra TaxID=373956 RepID=A0AAN8XI66_HALRR
MEFSTMIKGPFSRSSNSLRSIISNSYDGHFGNQITPEGLHLKVVGRKGSAEVFRNTTFVSTTSKFLIVLVEMARPIFNGGQNSVVELSMGTPEIPKEGWWRVRVVAAGQVEEHPFFLTTYFTTRFEVYVDLPYYTLASEEGIKGSFRAIFRTYMPVPGNATLTYSIRERNTTTYRDIATQLVPYAEGDHDFLLPMDAIMDNAEESKIHGMDVKVQVNFQYTFLGTVVNAYASTRIIEPTLKVRTIGASPIVFKPGMSLTTAVGVSYDDLEPLEENRLRTSTLIISPSIVSTSGSTDNLPKIVVEPKKEDPLPWKEFSTMRRQNVTKQDLLRFDEERTTRLLQELAYKSTFARYYKEGIFEFSIDIPKEAVSLLLSVTYQDAMSSASGVAKGVSFHSPNNQYLHITSSTPEAVVGTNAIFHVRSNFPMKKFQYMILAKGILIYSSSEEVSWTGLEGVQTLSVVVAKEMYPRFTLVVVHMTSDGELVTDSMYVSVKMQGAMARMHLNQDKDHSKRTVEAGIWAPAGSFFALSCDRIANHHLQGQNRITTARLLKASLKMEPHPRSIAFKKYRSREGKWSETLTTLSTENIGTWSLSALHISGLHLASDARVHQPFSTGMCETEVGFLECGDGSCYRQEEICDGRQHCTNGEDELQCLTTQPYEEDLRDAGPVWRSQGSLTNLTRK